MDLSHKIIIGLLVILILLTVYKKQENADNIVSTPSTGSANYSTEAISNIASVYSESLNGTASFNNIRITGNLDATNFKGIICAWSGTIENIPSGWELCDGKNGRPDLRGRFILGYNQPSNGAYLGTSYDGEVTKITPPGTPGGAQVGGNLAGVIGSVGGEIMHTLTPSEMPRHTHNYIRGPLWGGGNMGGQGANNWGNNANLEATDATGGGKYHNILPPFYVLAYIIKL